jgi:hypothetical protein
MSAMRPSRSVVFAAALIASACGGRIGLETSVPGGDDSGAPELRDAAASLDATTSRDATPSADATPSPDATPVPPPQIDASDRFSWMKQAMVGTWEGRRTDPWDTPAQVRIHFDASGKYTAHCIPDSYGCVWHYGVDDDLPGKTYALFDLHADGTGMSHIGITFSASEVLAGTLDSITIDPAAMSLSFDFFPTWLGQLGPVHFDLRRVA